MKILWIGGSHSRHLYYINAINKEFPVEAGIMQVRESILPSVPSGLSAKDEENFKRHFQDRDKAEKKYFGDQKVPGFPLLKVKGEDLNSDKTREFVAGVGPDLVLIFGSNLIKDPLLAALPEHTINLHLGLSPRYRGAATLFWPFYFMEPAYAGTTFHYITAEPDAGAIIHQVAPVLAQGDGIHDVACKCVLDSAREMMGLINILKKNGSWKRFRQKGTGKNFLSSDFQPHHLKVIYDVFNNDMVDHYLQGRLISRKPELLRQ